MYSLLALILSSGVLSSSYIIKIRTNRKLPLPSFHDRVNESGYKMKAKIIGAINAKIV
jgi:hypothetical protein